jgi:hypothetical protein
LLSAGVQLPASLEAVTVDDDAFGDEADLRVIRDVEEVGCT